MVWQAYLRGLLDASGLQSVALQAVQDLRCIRARHAFAPVDWTSLVKHLNDDIGVANAHLPAGKQITPVQLPERAASKQP